MFTGLVSLVLVSSNLYVASNYRLTADRECREDGFDLVLSLMGSRKVGQRHEVGASVSDLTISGCHIINISR